MSLGLWCQVGFWLLKATGCFFVERCGPLRGGVLTLFRSLPSALLPLTRSDWLFGKPSFLSGAVFVPASAAKDLDPGLAVLCVRGPAGSELKVRVRL